MRNIIFILIFITTAAGCTSDNTTKKESAKNDTAQLKTDTSLKINTDTSSSSLLINTLEDEPDQGQVTFSQKEKTLFYYDLKSKKGKIKLNNVEYVLDKYDFNKDSYKLSGKEITINAPNCKFKKNAGEDCGYGKIGEVTVTLRTQILNVKDVEVQDCPNY